MRPADAARLRVLLVDTLSASNDFFVELPIALDPLVDLTVFTVKGTRLRPEHCRRVIAAFPEYGGSRGKVEKLFSEFVATTRLAWRLWRHRDGVVHVQFFRSLSLELPLYLLMRPFLQTLVCTVHNILPHEPTFLEPLAYRLWYRLIDRAHVLSQHTGDTLIARYGIDPGAIVFAPHGNYDRFRHDYPPAARAATRAARGVKVGDTLVLFFGLVRDYKGVDRLIDAASRIEDTRVRVIVAGLCEEAELAERLQRQAERSGLGDRLTLEMRFLDNQTLSDLIEAADITVFPYQRIYQSGAVLLAMTYGKAIVASDLPGFREYLIDEVSALFCGDAEADPLARCIERLAADASLRHRLGARARADAAQRFAWPTVAQTIVAGYGRDGADER